MCRVDLQMVVIDSKTIVRAYPYNFRKVDLTAQVLYICFIYRSYNIVYKDLVCHKGVEQLGSKGLKLIRMEEMEETKKLWLYLTKSLT